MRSPLQPRGSLTERLVGFSAALLFGVIALSLAVSLLERIWPLLLGIGILSAAIALAAWFVRRSRRPW